ncbi:molybdenum cofactor guanylyltransferase MobA [Hahella ganghwensis]|uniref:molybdenum cofactor guanylyltransferase MobA n=1 Tax=Hahella ganghwensis TaxID=286420 RepID=UPI0003759441|nr:molybdenum cofactor guanylyltransferase MobA [Hahella ganghwensis]
MSDLIGLILAGGEGSRAGGKDKGLLQWQDIPLAEHIAKALQPTCDTIAISCNRNLREYQAITPNCFTDVNPSLKGPLAGLYSAWHLFPETTFLVSACDTPLLTREYALRMCPGQTDCIARIAWDGERQQYLHCLLSPKAHPVLKQYLNDGGKNVRNWLNLLNPELVDFSDCPEIFTNINTLEQLKDL